MRILLLTQDLKLAGAQRQLVELALGLDPDRYDVRVGVLEPGGPLTTPLVSHGIPLVPFPRAWRWDLTPTGHLARYVRREAIQVIHSFLFLPNFYGRLAGCLGRVPVMISSIRGVGIEGSFRYWLDVHTARLSNAIVVNSAAGRDDYIEHGGPPEKLVLIRNGLDPDRFRRTAAVAEHRRRWGLDRFREVVGMVASLETLKAQDVLVEAMVDVVRRRSDAGLLLVGEGSRRAQLEDLVRRLGLGNHVTFTGSVADPENVYPLLDVYVQASVSEGVSNSVLEAMFCGLPVVATDVGGNAEVVIDRETGYLVRPGDVGLLARPILDLLADPALRARLGRRGLARAHAEFGVEKMVQATAALYESQLRAVDQG